MNALPIVGILLAVAGLGCVRDDWMPAPRDAGGDAPGMVCGADASCADADAGVDAGAEADAPCVGAVCACSPGRMYCDDGCVDGPAAVYDGEHSADDGAGSRHAVHAEVAYAAGHTGRAFSFGGNDDRSYVELPSDVGDFGEGDFTISLWFNSGYRDGNQSMLARRLGCSVGVAFSGYDVRLAYTGGLYVELWTTVSQYALSSQTVLNDRRWHHLAIVRGGLQVRLVVDGVVASTSAFHGSMNDRYHTPTYLGVGRCAVRAPGSSGGWDDTHWFDGLLDELAFFPRALTEGELTATAQGRCAW